MPTTPRIPKDIILDAALQILIRDGYSAVNIKTIAKELNCSTQPISWHFGNMNSLRKALGEYACTYADQKTMPSSADALEAFSQVGSALTDIAFDEPNLYRFLFMNGSGGYCIGGMQSLTELSENKEMIGLIALQNNLDWKVAASFLENMIIYTMGLLSLYVSGVIRCNKDDILHKLTAIKPVFLQSRN